MNNNDQEQERVTALIRETAVSFPYPPTPNIAGRMRFPLSPPSQSTPRRLVWAAAVLLVTLGLLFAVPQVRAAILQFIRAGAITIFVNEVGQGTATPISAGAAELPALETAVLENARLLSLAEAQSQVSFPLRYPPSSGLPDSVFLRDIAEPGLRGEVVIMLWRDPAAPERANMLLYQIGAPHFGLKEAAIESIASTRVDDMDAFWVEDGHTIGLPGAAEQETAIVTRDVLIWSENDLTYRLESDLSLAEAVQVAESLQPIEGKIP